jgi:hypothetical protein
MGVTDALYGIIDEPEMMHALAKRIADGYMSLLDQAEEKGLLCHHQALIHCTGAWTDELPHEGFDEKKPRCEDLWMFGLAQMFSTVSPAMFEEYEIDYMRPICQRFGLVYYGCCDPLDGKMKEVRKLPHVRKVSMSPWADKERGAANIGHDFVFSNKPNPAFLADPTGFHDDIIRNDLTQTREICRKNGSPLEFILKDLSTINKEPERLDKWADIAMRVAQG